MDLFLLGLSTFFVAFVTSSATILAKRLFGETQKPPPNTSANVTVVVVYVFFI